MRKIRKSDRDLLKLLQTGDRKTFETLYYQYFRLLCYEARGYISDNLVIEELVNDVFVRFWQHCKSLPENIVLRPYLITSIHNACISYQRHLKAMTAMTAELNEQYKYENTLYDIGENPINYVISKELEDKIEKAINNLPAQYQKAFLLSRYHDFSYNEIAERMNISVNTVKTYMKNALSQLRKIFNHTENYFFCNCFF